MGKNEYSPFESKWSIEDWLRYCPNFEYRIKQKNEFPPFLPESLTSKLNCAMVAASGNGTQQTFVFQAYRVDGVEIDEHQYIASFDVSKNKAYGGFIDHGNYPGRTTVMPPDMLSAIAVSGVNVDFKFPTKPPGPSGSLDELIEKNLISGFLNSVEVQQNKEHFP